jgi:hypothetical protein
MFDSLANAWGWLTGSQKLGRVVEAEHVETDQYWRHGGVSEITGLVAAAAAIATPKHLSTNFPIPSMVAGNSDLYFLCGRSLLRHGKHYSGVRYQQLQSRHWKEACNETGGRQATRANRPEMATPEPRWGPDRRFQRQPSGTGHTVRRPWAQPPRTSTGGYRFRASRPPRRSHPSSPQRRRPHQYKPGSQPGAGRDLRSADPHRRVGERNGRTPAEKPRRANICSQGR